MNLPGFFAYKRKQYSYFMDHGLGSRRFLLSHLNSEKRRTLGWRYNIRGAVVAKEKGVNVTPGVEEHLNEIFYDKVYDVEGFLPGPSDMVLDIGAYVGDYAVYCSVLYGVRDLHFFEPIPANYAIASRFIEANPHMGVHGHMVALSDGNGDQSLGIDAQSMGFMDEEGGDTIVPTATLDSFRLRPTLMKVDVEGMEVKVLKGAVKTIQAYHPRIIIETHSAELNEQVFSFLTNEGYVRTNTTHVHRSHGRLFQNNFYTTR